ncbi:type IV secretion protein IcmL [Legionella qingyii]|uniref:Type IV secretion protein IcmL n=1 Tax=Legionella qingyii TaxID=2184757 RepID=A0A317U4H4_9GAMM|nr:DotI/IcmL family type IV secretion protein [Legionella qingyii]PWY55717.1 type IV secretion protein IcmL [Legionella qingyii]RUR21615.1 type IV secretion protein IcmL [Legionella qingyii]RUR25117.1 type IV secretion protein IcmL [Legionella qingyii]
MIKKLAFIFLSIFFQLSYAQPEPVQLSVWVNEAIVATYTYSYKNYLEDQKKIAKYFTADAWIAYSNALNASKLPEDVQKNLYSVSAVATAPPVITNIDPTHWKATMGLIVVYQNPQYQQRQNLKVNINFMVAPSGQGVRGYTITSLQAIINKQPCKCDVESESESTPANTPPAGTPTPNNAKP